MAKMHFKYSTMNSGKSIDLMHTVFNYEENGFKALVMKPEKDTKAGSKISSRIGLEREVDVLIGENDSIYDLLIGSTDVNAIFVDEAQFLTPNQVDELFNYTKALNTPVICYGLRLNFKGELFPGSKKLMEVCEELEELPTLCSCGEIARYAGRKVNGKYRLTGEEVVIDGTANVEYKPLCGTCFLKKVKRVDLSGIRRYISK